MATAVFVLAIIAGVLAVPAALAATAFGSVLTSNTGGALGANVFGGGILALVAAGVGIVGTAVARRRPRLASSLLGVAGIAGAVGTLAFIPASVLYVIAAVLALFAQPIPAVTGAGSSARTASSVGTAALPVSARAGAQMSERDARPRPPGARFVPRLSGRLAVIAGATAVTVLVAGFATTARGEDEIAAARALFKAVEQHDEIALAQLLPDASRTADIAGDAARALATAFDGSGLSLLSTEWTGRIAEASGVEVRFEGLSFVGQQRKDDRARVRATGTFAPRHENPLVNAGLSLLRRPFQVDLALIRTEAGWRIDAPAASLPATEPRSASPAAARAPSQGAAASASAAQPASSSAPTASQSPTPSPRPFAATWTADFDDPAGSGLLPAGDELGYVLRYQAGHALMADCDEAFTSTAECLWGVTRDSPGFSALAATAATNSDNWGILFRVAGPSWHKNSRNSVTIESAVSAWLRPGVGEFRISAISKGEWTGLARGTSAAVRKSGPNTIELALEGAELVMLVNGTEVARVPDTQGRLGLGYGVYVDSGESGDRFLDVSHFAGR